MLVYECVNVWGFFAHRLQVYPLHSTVTLEEQNGVFLVPVPGYRKVKFTVKPKSLVCLECLKNVLV